MSVKKASRKLEVAEEGLHPCCCEQSNKKLYFILALHL